MGLLWVVLGRCGIVVGRCGSLWVVVGRCGSFRVLVTTKQNRRKADKRKCQRYAENEKSIKTRILNVDEETLNDEDYVIDHGDLILSAVSCIKAFEIRYLVSMLDSTSATTHSIKLMKENLSAHSLKEFDRITDTTKNNKTQEQEKESESSSSCSSEDDRIESDAE